MPATDPVRRALQEGVEDGTFPGAVLFVRLRRVLLKQYAVGRVSDDPTDASVKLDTVYDLASLTKPLATATAILTLVQQGLLAIDDRLEQILPELRGSSIGGATVRHGLTHSTGLPGWRPFYERLESIRELPSGESDDAARRAVLQYVREEPLIYPTGSRSLYSDLGFMLLGIAIERVSGVPLDAYCQRNVFDPLGAQALGFLPTRNPSARAKIFGNSSEVAPTEQDTWRGRVLCGEVHDENAYALGGVAGHAGLFGTGPAVLALSEAWLEGYQGRGEILSPDLVRQFASRQRDIPDSSWALGWDTPSVPSSSGTLFSDSSFGHLGYTGTSLWIDPSRDLEVVLLSNRVHPTRRNERIKGFRPMIHDLIVRSLMERRHEGSE